MKTHEAQNAAFAETCNYLDELDFLQRLANTIKREQHESLKQAPASGTAAKIVKAAFP